MNNWKYFHVTANKVSEAEAETLIVTDGHNEEMEQCRRWCKEISSKFSRTHDGQYLFLNRETGEFAMGRTMMDASGAYFKKHPRTRDVPVPVLGIIIGASDL